MLISFGIITDCSRLFPTRSLRWTRVFWSLLAALPFAAAAQHQLSTPQEGQVYVAPASDEAGLALKRMKPAPGLKVDLWASEPMLANPVAFCFDEKGRV